ncbi:MAG: hypothetical protein HC945_02230, partial [Nitrosarchaeum sp.]|nr:hypothetical protein [Nitrosarchaeum sp.]
IDPTSWWNSSYLYRKQITITTGSDSPATGYTNYTVQIQTDTTGDLFQDDGDDIRVIYYNGTGNEEIDIHLIGPDSANTLLRFALQADITAGGSDNDYYLYYANPSAANPPRNLSQVYLWYDNASSDQEAAYTQGRFDSSCLGVGYGNGVSHNSAGYYLIDTGDNQCDSIRPTGITELDVYVEYEQYQTDSYPNNMESGPVARATVTGSGATEDSSAYYGYMIADSTFDGAAYPEHDDIIGGERSTVIVTNGALGQFPATSWTRLGLATWNVNPTNLSAWYDAAPLENTTGGWGTPRFSGTHDAGSDYETAGQAGLWLQQDESRVRNILIRKYTYPEPTGSLGSQEDASKGDIPSTANPGYSIVFMDFESQTDFPEEGQCGTAAANQCAATEPWDGFDWCQAPNGGYGMCASTEANAIGTRGFECRACDRNDADNNGGLYINLSADACGGEPCQTIHLSYYQVVESMDGGSEGSAVFVSDDDGILRAVSTCIDGDPDCDCNAITGCTRATMGSYAEFISADLCLVEGINCSQNLSIYFTANDPSLNHGDGDYFAWDEINITGYSNYAYIPGSTETPFYTTTPNPLLSNTASCLADMQSGDSCQTTWIVNATGELDTTWTFFVTYESINYSANVSENISAEVDLTIKDSLIPRIESIECNDGSLWVACDSLLYQDDFAAVRTNCTSQSGGSITNVTFTFRNINDNKIYFSATETSLTGGYFLHDPADFTLSDSGDFSLSITCRENPETTEDINWTIPFGNLTATVLAPTFDQDIPYAGTFVFTSRVTCTGGECGDINFTLDPTNWWNLTLRKRTPLNITPGPNTPYGGYENYTVQAILDTSTSDFQADASDLFVVRYNGSEHTVLDRHVINPGTTQTLVRFKLEDNITSYDDTYHIYHDAGTSLSPPANLSKVYLWHDNASTDREAEYTQGRVDATCLGAGFQDSIAHNTGGYYDFNTDDNFCDSLRPTGINERDVYIEYEEYQTDAYPTEMTSGTLARWQGTGTGGTEDSSHWYYYSFASSTFEAAGPYAWHDDLQHDECRNHHSPQWRARTSCPPTTGHAWRMRLGCQSHQPHGIL